HPAWLLKDANGPIVWDTRDDWGGKIYSLDGAHPEVQAWLHELARRLVRDWGFDYLKIDFLLWATAGVDHSGGVQHAEAYRTGRPVGTGTAEPEVAPSIVAGDQVVSISGPWRFRTGDDAQYGARAYDEEAWETIPVPQRWEDAGHPDYDGFGWYRTRFPLPTVKDQSAPIFLELGKIDDVDQTFLNGVKVGQTGEFPPDYRGEWSTYR